MQQKSKQQLNQHMQPNPAMPSLFHALRHRSGAADVQRSTISLAACLIALFVIGAQAQQASTNSWHPNTKLLGSDASRPPDPFTGDAATTLAHDVKQFYELLRDKQWIQTYKSRAKAFREDISEDQYLAEVKERGELWGLANYDVLSVTFRSSISSTNVDEAILICKFTELPAHSVSYSTVFWHREDGAWKCLSAGPNRLTIFNGTRVPTIDWR
jgi:hypothetical protein